MYMQFPELGRTVPLLKAQDEDLAIATELMRERANLEQNFIEGLRALVDKHRLQSQDENREYTKVLITAFEQEIEARIICKPEVPEHLPVDKEEFPTGITGMERLQDTQQRHEDAYAALLASRNELEKWRDDKSMDLKASRMPLVELKYRWSVHHQRQCSKTVREWYETKLSPLVETHHSALEATKKTMIRTITANIDCASRCSRIYSRALESASGLLPLNQRSSIEEILEAEMDSYALRPADYYNWFYDGKPSPLLFGIGTITIDPEIATEMRLYYYWLLKGEDRLACLQAERENDLRRLDAVHVIRFELDQFAPLLPLNSSEFERLVSASLVLILPNETYTDTEDESVWEPLGSTRRKQLLKMSIARADSYWLTFRYGAYDIVDVIFRKWDFENDRPKP